MNLSTAQDFLARIRRHRQDEERIWDEMRAHPDYQANEDKIINEALEALDDRDGAEECANAAMDSFNFVPDPENEGDFVHKDDLEARAALRAEKLPEEAAASAVETHTFNEDDEASEPIKPAFEIGKGFITDDPRVDDLEGRN